MTILPSDLLSLARRLLVASDECSRRSAVSRAHYAAFHSCRGFALKYSSFDRNPKGSHHKALADYLMRFAEGSSDRQLEIREIGRVFEQLRLLRSRADYSIDLDFPSAKAESGVNLADYILVGIAR